MDSDATITDNGGNLIGTAGSPIDPLLGPLANNGGPTMTHALLTGSPAIDAGDPNAVAGMGGVPSLISGAPWTRVFDGDERAAPGSTSARSRNYRSTSSSIRWSTRSDGDYSAGDFSLREAIALANASVYPGDSHRV